jgi:hypothetical protein
MRRRSKPTHEKKVHIADTRHYHLHKYTDKTGVFACEKVTTITVDNNRLPVKLRRAIPRNRFGIALLK